MNLKKKAVIAKDCKMKAQFEVIDPDRARELMGDNGHNRKLKRPHINWIASQMKSGKWRATGESIIIAANGSLSDGQHRLQAIIETGLSLVFLVVYEGDPEDFKVLNTGTGRTAGDACYIQGYERSTQLAAAVRFILRYKKRNVAVHTASRAMSATNTEVLDWIEENPLIHTYVTDAAKYCPRGSSLITKTLATGMLFLLSEVDGEWATKFFDVVFKFEDHGKFPVLDMLRARLIKNVSSNSKLSSYYLVALIVKAWNYFISGESPAMLRYIKETESYPKIGIPSVDFFIDLGN